ncbi:MAG: amidohydrolase family protein [Lachnospiraceae bacterium]
MFPPRRQIDYSNPNRVAPLLKRFPNLAVIAAHFGGYTVWEEASYALAGAPNTVCRLLFLAIAHAQKATELCAATADRVLFGTDYPM